MKLKPGDCALRVEPYVVVATDLQRLTRCDHCLERSTKKCSACKAVSYCSRECQKVAWSRYHKIECRCLVNHAPKVPAWLEREFVKVLARHLGDDPGGAVWRDSAGLRRFCDLMSHEATIRIDYGRMLQFAELEKWLREFTSGVLTASQIPSSDVLLGIFGRIMINGLQFRNDLGIDLGHGMCLSASVFDHSCVYTARMYMQSGRVIIKSLTNADSVESLKTSYVSNLLPWSVRTGLLQGQYYFTCQCQLCRAAAMTDGEPDELKCSRAPDCLGVCSFSESFVDKEGRVPISCVCDTCGSPPITRDPGRVRAWRSRITQASPDLVHPPPAVARELLGSPENPLHPQHRLSICLYNAIFGDCSQFREHDDPAALAEAERIGEFFLLPALHRHVGRLCPFQQDFARLHMELANLAYRRRDAKKALAQWDKAEAIYKITLEPDAPTIGALRSLYQDLRVRLDAGCT